MEQALHSDQGVDLPFSLLVGVFIKAEVAGKNKPRPIASHGAKRVWGLAR